ncbi:MAG: oligosaccharide flippase family protein, partial [Erythrobacter sp.]|nr:oligosaccharide flippase family protein [Erythrobacter sp.]
MAALAKGGRTNVFGFVLRLVARLPFLFIAGRLYGLDAVGRYASALILIELVALMCSLGEKRGLAHRLTEGEGPKVNLVFDGLLAAFILSLVAGGLLYLFPAAMFPNGMNSPLDLLLVTAIPAFALTEILLAAQAYKYDVATTVRARAVVEPWTISIMLGVFYLVPQTREAGLALAYIVSIYAAMLTAAWPFLRSYGLPQHWRPRPRAMLGMTSRALPLVGADAVEWSTRRVDIFILGLFASPAAVAFYYMAQQIASLPQKLKTSFEPILGPVITKNLKAKDYAAIAKAVRQVGFWIIAVQLGIALMLGIPGKALMGLIGPQYVFGTGAMAILLAAEVVASMAVVSEAVLVYLAKKRNLGISLAVIALQALLTIGAVLGAKQLGLDEGYQAAGAALALMLALLVSSVAKAHLLKKLLKASVGNLRLALVWATAAAVLVGQLAIRLPEWLELALGVPMILAAYGWVIWTR